MAGSATRLHSLARLGQRNQTPLLITEEYHMTRNSSEGTGDTDSAFLSGRIIRGGQLATAIAAIIGLLLLLMDRLPNHPAPKKLSVSLTQVRVSRPVTLRHFFAAKDQLANVVSVMRNDRMTRRDIHALLNMKGTQVRYLLAIDGPPGRRLELKPIVYRAPGLIPAKGPSFVQVQPYRSEAWHDAAPDQTWVPDPADPGDYYVEVRMTERRRNHRPILVASARTPSFPIRRR